MRIFLVRHGQSLANADKRVHLTTADHAIPLSELGRKQAQEAADFLKGFFHTEVEDDEKTRLWHSPYLRARETARIINMEIRDLYERRGRADAYDMREHLLLGEQQFGLFDGLSHEGVKSQIETKYPDEYAHYKKCEAFEGGFWAKMPLGESKFDLCVRVHQAFGTFHRDAKKHKIKNLIIVAHGSTNRAFAMQWLHRPFEWFEKEPNPKNGSVRIIDDNQDKGYYFP